MNYNLKLVNSQFVDKMDSGRIWNSNLQAYLITIRISNTNLKFSKFYESRISNPNLHKMFSRIRISNLDLKFD